MDNRTARRQMVHTQLQARGIRDPAVLAAFGRVPRHRFVPSEHQRSAYADHPLSIGSGQTISQPYVVAYMLEQAELRPGDRVLEIGTGSGYQTALLAELACEVYSVERVAALEEQARTVLGEMGYNDIHLRLGDGTQGWQESAPYDAIIGSAAPPEIPRPLLSQLAPGGRLVLPVGSVHQELVLVRRTPDSVFQHKHLLAVRFVPMLSE